MCHINHLLEVTHQCKTFKNHDEKQFSSKSKCEFAILKDILHDSKGITLQISSQNISGGKQST